MGAELVNIVSALLRTASGEAADCFDARLIHQARVRRDVVVALIEDMKQRGHRAYTHVDMAAVRRRAQQLPTDGVPPEMFA